MNVTKSAALKTSVPSNNHSSIESRAIYAALISGAAGFMVGLILFWNSSVSLFGLGLSLGFVGSIFGGVAALVTFLAVASTNDVVLTKESPWRKRLDTWSLALVHGLLAFLGYALIFYMFSQSFKDAKIDMWASSVIIALSTGFAAYAAYLSASSMTSVRVSMLLAMFMVSGIFISMLTSSDPHWWYFHFSSLGAGGGVSGYAFNLTLILAGLIVVALTSYITNDFNRLKTSGTVSRRAKAGILKGLLIGIGLMLACVGLFIYDQFPSIHNFSAGGMGILFLIIIAMLPILTPGFPKAFFIASYALLGALLACAWLGGSVHYLNLTMFELLAAAIIFTWLVIFVRNVAAMLNDEASGKAKLESVKGE